MAGGGTTTTMVLGRTSMADRRSLRGVVATGMDDAGETDMDSDIVTEMDGIGAMDSQVGWGSAMDPRMESGKIGGGGALVLDLG
jgi:hypothetical protein